MTNMSRMNSIPSSPKITNLETFNHKRLNLAGKRRRLTAKAVAINTGLSPLTISRLEKGENQPDDATVDKLAKALSFPRSFFYDDDPEEIDTQAVSFRSLTKMSAKERDAALSAGVLGLQLSDWVEERFSLPEAEPARSKLRNGP